MRMGKKIFLFLITGMLLTMLFSVNILSSQAEEKEKKVRVGIFKLGKFMGMDEDGNVYGYNVDFLNEISKINHWKYEYIFCENWNNATEKLENGEIDLLAPAQSTVSLKERFDFATLTMGTEAAAIYTKVSNTELLYEDFATMDKLVYGCPENSTFAKKFESEYTVQNGMNPTIKYYANTTELLSALESDEVDAIVTNIMFASDDLKILGWFAPLPVYYVAQKGNQELLDELDKAMMEIMVKEPTFQAKLESQYFPVYDSTHITFEEMEFAKELPEIKVGYITNQNPLAYTNEDTGEYDGITSKVMQSISESSGIKMKFVPVYGDKISEDYLKKNNIYIIANYDYNDAGLH